MSAWNVVVGFALKGGSKSGLGWVSGGFKTVSGLI